MIELRDLRCFLTVAHEQHLGRAARRLNMAQAPLTQQLRELERSLGITLFEQSNRRVALTPAGAALADGARRTLTELERAVDQAQRTGSDPGSTLRVRSAPYATDAVVAGLLQRFRSVHPNVRIDLVADAQDSTLVALRGHRVDLAFVLGPVDGEVTEGSGLRALLVHRERFQLALPAGHALASKRQVSLKALAGEPIVVLSPAGAPHLRALITAACHGAGFVPCIAAEADGFDAVLHAAGSRRGVGFVPASLSQPPASGVELRLLTGMTATVDVAMIYRSGDDGPVQRFVTTARESLR